MEFSMHGFIARRPLIFVILVMLILEAFVLLGLLSSQILDVPVTALDLPLMLLNSLLAIVILTALRWWRAAGFNAPSAWQNLHFLILPVLLLLAPALLLQLQLPPANRFIALVVVTLLIGFQEEAIFRGVLLHALRTRGILQAVLISALLFGIIHANSFFVGRDPLFVLSQIIASFLGAIGLAALRLRINSIWPLIGLHALNDLVQFVATGGIEAQVVAIYIPILKIAIAVVMALYGLYLLRGVAERQALSH
jgi:membrane protease YdiL (CAAX protease family)